MSDAAVLTGAAPSAPVTPAAPEAAPSQSPSTPAVSIQEARGNLRDLLRTPASPAQPRNETGQFTSTKTEADQGEAASDAPEPTGVAETGVGEQSGSPTGTTGSEATAEVPEGMVVIEVPEGHYLRERGREKLPPVPKEFENDFRALLNDPVRRREVSQAEAARDDAMLTASKWEKTAEHFVNKLEQVLKNPQLVVDLHHLREQYGDEMADRQIMQLLSEEQYAIDEVLGAVEQQYSEQAAIREAEKFRSGAERALRKTFPMLTPGDIDYLIKTHAQAVVNGQAQLHWSHLKAYAERYYEGHPAVKADREREAALQAQKEREAEEARQRQEAEAAAARARNPLGRMSGVAASAAAGSDVAPATERMTVMEAKAALRGRFR